MSGGSLHDVAAYASRITVGSFCAVDPGDCSGAVEITDVLIVVGEDAHTETMRSHAVIT